jgi:hypothetical protein
LVTEWTNLAQIFFTFVAYALINQSPIQMTRLPRAEVTMMITADAKGPALK